MRVRALSVLHGAHRALTLELVSLSYVDVVLVLVHVIGEGVQVNHDGGRHGVEIGVDQVSERDHSPVHMAHPKTAVFVVEPGRLTLARSERVVEVDGQVVAVGVCHTDSIPYVSSHSVLTDASVSTD